jgi:hypothetical protein
VARCPDFCGKSGIVRGGGKAEKFSGYITDVCFDEAMT